MYSILKFVSYIIFIVTIFCCGRGQDKITMSNVDEFKDKLRAELPVGSPYEDIDSYLRRLGLEYSFVKDDKTFYAIVPEIGRFRIIFVTSLLIRIRVDEQRKLNSIEFELEHTGI